MDRQYRSVDQTDDIDDDLATLRGDDANRAARFLRFDEREPLPHPHLPPECDWIFEQRRRTNLKFGVAAVLLALVAAGAILAFVH
jgi:hypothetical protein